MYFSRVSLDIDGVPATTLGRLVQGDQYLGHQVLWRLFSTGQGNDREQARPFLFRDVQSVGQPTFYVVSERAPEDRDGHWLVDSKTYDPQLQPGMRLRFDLRANPVRREKTASGQRRHDVVMDAKKQYRTKGEEVAPSVVEHEAGKRWLEARASRLGFNLSDQAFAAFGYQQHVIYKRGGRPIRFSSLDMRGVLEVTDTEAFRRTLWWGIGPSKSFGCGLLLVRPV